MGDIFPRRSLSRRLMLALASVVALGCGEQQVAPPQPADSRPPVAVPTQRPAGQALRIVFLGDSLSAGFGLAESQAFPALVQDRLRQRGHPVDVVNAGVSGDTTAGGLSRLDWVLRSEPDLLVVELGGNDALRGQPLANTEANLRAIVRRGRAAGCRILLLGMDVPSSYGPDYAGGFAELYARIAVDEQVDLVPNFIREVGLKPSLMMADGLHPTAEGHRKLAQLLVPAIEGILKLP